MSVLIDANTKIVTQSFTGENGAFPPQPALGLGVEIVAGRDPRVQQARHRLADFAETARFVANNAIVSYTDPV